MPLSLLIGSLCHVTSIGSIVGMLYAVAPEQKRYAPYSSKSDNGVKYSRYHSAHAAEYGGDDVKLKYADKSPVQSADNQQNQCKRIHFSLSFSCDTLIMHIFTPYNTKNICRRERKRFPSVFFQNCKRWERFDIWN